MVKNSVDPITELKRQCAIHGGQHNFAKAKGLSPQYISDVVNKKRGVSEAICEALELKKIIYYARKS